VATYGRKNLKGREAPAWNHWGRAKPPRKKAVTKHYQCEPLGNLKVPTRKEQSKVLKRGTQRKNLGSRRGENRGSRKGRRAQASQKGTLVLFVGRCQKRGNQTHRGDNRNLKEAPTKSGVVG